MTAAADFRRILVICTRQIGDVLLTTPLIAAAQRRWPEARIDVLGFAGTLGMLHGNPQVHALIEVQPGSGWRDSLGLIRRLWRRYDLALIAQHTDRAHLYGWIASRLRSGQLPRHGAPWWKRKSLVHAVRVNAADSHAVVEKLKLLAPWQRVESAQVCAPPAAALPAAIEQALRPPYAVVQVPSLVRYKQWPLGHYAELARLLIADGCQVVFSGGPSAADRHAVAEVVRVVESPSVLNVAGQLDLRQMSGLLRCAALYVGPDTSITHLAAACGTPVVALYGPIDPRFWGPWAGRLPLRTPYRAKAPCQRGATVSLMQADVHCVPCNRAGCANHDDSESLCLHALSPDLVMAEARERLSGPLATPADDQATGP